MNKSIIGSKDLKGSNLSKIWSNLWKVGSVSWRKRIKNWILFLFKEEDEQKEIFHFVTADY